MTKYYLCGIMRENKRSRCGIHLPDKFCCLATQEKLGPPGMRVQRLTTFLNFGHPVRKPNLTLLCPLANIIPSLDPDIVLREPGHL
jgi:hypothetical protein